MKYLKQGVKCNCWQISSHKTFSYLHTWISCGNLLRPVATALTLTLASLGKMKTSIKIVLTIPTILQFFALLGLIFPVEFAWIWPSMKSYRIYMTLQNLLILIQIIVLLKILWSFKNLEKSVKINWTWLIIIFTLVTSQIFIWKKFDEFAILNKQ